MTELSQPPRITLKHVLGLFIYSGASFYLLYLFANNNQTPRSRKLRVENTPTPNTAPPSWMKQIKPYTAHDVLQTQLAFVPNKRNMLMIFDPATATFNTYHETNEELLMGRNYNMNYLLAHAFFTNFPIRFQEGAPPLQILYSTEDYPTLRTPVAATSSDSINYAPVLQFGSVPKYESVLDPIDTISEMPFPNVAPCIVPVAMERNIREKCIFNEKSMQTMLESPMQWDELKPQIIWRGSDYQFLERFGYGFVSGTELNIDFASGLMTTESITQILFEQWNALTPRWRGVALSLQAAMDTQQKEDKQTLPWIDVKFFDKVKGTNSDFEPFLSAGADISTKTFLSWEEQMTYKYHIDFGGGGGTSWEGTLTKLAMPGVLFHHETIMKDWYYDEIQPWVHYIPVQMDLSDLKEKFEWAESHPQEVQEISENATNLIRQMKSNEYIKNLYWKYFVHHLGNVAKAYQYTPSSPAAAAADTIAADNNGESLQSILDTYEANGIKLTKFATCDKEQCVWADGRNKKYNTNVRLSFD